ncbi:unnamed protein product [Leptidea sinapis]|uniref:Fibronectin type-III domain-containing protein n=1 Tax=Leptidea sinapis TaxID=189913 RepID=A0A5E4R456_9NEOP|nr:unnamed protein product [Leptidea sinapis]
MNNLCYTRERMANGGATRHEMNVASLQPNTTYVFTAQAFTRNAASPHTAVRPRRGPWGTPVIVTCEEQLRLHRCIPLEVKTPGEEVIYGPPQDVRVEPLGAHALRVSWSPPVAGAVAAPPAKYAVSYSEVESGREQSVWCASSCVVEGLRAGSQYRVRVAAAGGAAIERGAATPAATPAAPPANLTARPLSHTSIQVRWDAPPPRTHGGPLTGYKIRYRAAGATRRRADTLTTPADVRRADLTNLEPSATYQIRICAINANGSGPFSEWVSARTAGVERAETSVPDLPPPLTARAGRDWISVWWSGGGGGGSGARGWWLGWGLGVPDEHSRELPRDKTSYVIRGLESNSEYVISLRASNALGLGPAVYATVRTRPLGPDDPDEPDGPDEPDEPDDTEDEEEDDTPPLIPPVGLKVIMLSGTTAVVYWTDPTLPKGQAATDGRHYVVRWSVAGGATDAGAGPSRARTYNVTDLNCMLDDLKPFTTYEFSVKLIKDKIGAEYQENANKYTQPTQTELKTSLQYDKNESMSAGGRESSWSMIASNTTLEAAPASPPRDLRVAPAQPAARAADLVWTAPARPNGRLTGAYHSPHRTATRAGDDTVLLAGYVIMYAIQRAGASTGGAEEWTAVGVAGERGRARVDRLRPRTTYAFKIQARNSKGLGPFSAAVVYTTGVDTGEGAGLASATSAWLWASAGGACAVLALAAALALSLCCRRQAPLSPDTSTYQKASASAGIKPPDLWIHHDQMELKHIDKSIHSSASKSTSIPLSTLSSRGPSYRLKYLSAGSVDGGLVSSSLTLGRAGLPPAEYEPARPPPPPAASLDRRYAPAYVGISTHATEHVYYRSDRTVN